jgi:IS30 family transposase
VEHQPRVAGPVIELLSQQVGRHLRLRHPERAGMWLCHESIYQAVYQPGTTLLSPPRVAPQHRSSNENANGLLRQYFRLVLGTDLSTHAPQHLRADENEIKDRPRHLLAHRLPAELFTALLTSAKHPLTTARRAASRSNSSRAVDTQADRVYSQPACDGQNPSPQR